MRTILLVACAAAVGCQVENELQYRSTVRAETDGVVLSRDGLNAFAAMAGTTCTLDTRWGCAVDDQDLPTDEERIFDHFDGVTLAVSADDLHFMDGGTWTAGADVHVEGIQSARLTDAGFLALRTTATGCMLKTGDEDVSMPAALCAAESIDVDRAGALIAATPDGVYRADAQGYRRIADGADRVAVDPALDQLYVATTGTRVVKALDHDGTQLWSIERPGAVQDIATRGDKGDLVVLTSADDGFGTLERIDGATGAVMSDSRIPVGEGDIVVSGNGRMITVVLADEIHNFEMIVKGENAPIGDESVSCIDLPVRQSRGFGSE